MNQNEIVCQNCGFANSSEVLFCRKCGAQSKADGNEPEKILVLPDEPVKVTGISCGRIFVGLVGVFFFLMFVAIFVPMGLVRRHNPERAREKACYANMRVILGAIEMYNMDNANMIDTFHDYDATDQNGVLVKGRYLKSPISRPEHNCNYSGKEITGTGRIVCREHGTVEGPND